MAHYFRRTAIPNIYAEFCALQLEDTEETEDFIDNIKLCWVRLRGSKWTNWMNGSCEPHYESWTQIAKLVKKRLQMPPPQRRELLVFSDDEDLDQYFEQTVE